jgi:hypothetical protein
MKIRQKLPDYDAGLFPKVGENISQTHKPSRGRKKENLVGPDGVSQAHVGLRTKYEKMKENK